MGHKIIAITDDDTGSREDANVYYARFLLVSSDTLAFNEPIFSGKVINADDHPTIVEGEDRGEEGGREISVEKMIDYLRGLGYDVEEPESQVFTLAVE